ncbi:hypothetical protein U9M48_039264 [Paspalum notatum var. saurae]|uniref:Uncharacterized protein n=1 Tax=Paspalum notatum var. saurae TaxID=547442 RepID=A0AAQ3UJA5_PASNO
MGFLHREKAGNPVGFWAAKPALKVSGDVMGNGLGSLAQAHATARRYSTLAGVLRDKNRDNQG